MTGTGQRVILASMLTILLLSLATPTSLTLPDYGSDVLKGYPAPGLSGFKTLIVYLGPLNNSNLLWLDYDILVFAGTPENMNDNYWMIRELMNRGVEVYAYPYDNHTPLEMGVLFRNVINGSWRGWDYLNYTISIISAYAGRVNGVFLDDCDPDSFNHTEPGDPYLEAFNSSLTGITGFAHSVGLKVFINGVRGFAGLGDYYLWDGLISRVVNGTVVYDESFYNSSNTNPYRMAHGIDKYDYLYNNGLLDRTIGLSYSPPSDPGTALPGYYAARILGLAGWGYSPPDHYDVGGFVEPLKAPLLGPALSSPVLNSTNSTMLRLFLTGPVELDVSSGTFQSPVNITNPPPVIDGYLDDVYIGANATFYIPPYFCVTDRVTGIYYLATPRTLYLLLEYYHEIPASPLSTLYVYIDADKDNSTGYPVYGVGAEYLLETNNSLRSILYRFIYNGTNWTLRRIGNLSNMLFKYHNSTPHDYYLEYGLDRSLFNTSRIELLTLIYSCSGDLNTTSHAVINMDKTTLLDPTIYYKMYLAPRNGYALVARLEVSADKTIIIAEAPTGAFARYTVYTPYPNISRVLKNSTPLGNLTQPNATEGYTVIVHTAYYTGLVVQVRHGSPVNITIIPASSLGLPGNNETIPGKTTPANTSAMNPVCEPFVAPVITVVILFSLAMYSSRKR